MNGGLDKDMYFFFFFVSTGINSGSREELWA